MEVVISLAVFSVLTLIFAASVPMAEKAANVNGQYSQALSLCQHKIDQLRAVGYGRINYTELSDAGIIDDSPSANPFSFKLADEVVEYLPQPNATLTIQTVATNQLRVTATVVWKNTHHETKTSTVSLSAVIANVE